jgi:hypothetical protein
MEESGRFLRNNAYVHRVRISEELVNGSEVQISCPAARGPSSKHNLSHMFFANEASHYLGHAATLQLGYLHASFTQHAERFANTRLSQGNLGHRGYCR